MRVLVFFLAAVLSLNANAEGTPFFATVDTSLQAGQTLPLADDIQFEFVTDNAQALVNSFTDWNGISATIQGQSTVVIKQKARPAFAGPATDAYSAASFVIDFEEPSVKEFVSGFKAVEGHAFSPQQLAEYVNKYINDPTYIRGFDIASVVARQRSGDCTEYAVLTAALARALAHPARVVLGTAILNQGDALGAYGHAWVEVWYKGRWQIVDAALFPVPFDEIYYMPVAALENEGLGYAMSLMSAYLSLPGSLTDFKSL